MNSLLIRLFMLAFFLLLPLSLYAQDNKPALCSEFQRYLNQPAGLTSYAVEEKEIQQDEFNFTIPNIDVDGDKIEDKILLFRTGSASIIPADDSSVTLILSSTGEKFTVEMQRFFVILYKSKYYIVAINRQGEKGPVFESQGDESQGDVDENDENNHFTSLGNCGRKNLCLG